MKKRRPILNRAGLKKVKNLMGSAFTISGVIGLSSLWDDLKAWKAFWDISINWASSISLDLATALARIPESIHTIATIWRNTLHPIIDTLTYWLPFTVPTTLKDLILLGFFLFAGRRKARKIWSRAYEKKKERIDAIMHKYLKVPTSPFISYSTSDARDFLLAKTGDPKILTSQHERLLQKFDLHFGEDAEEFAYTVLNTPEIIIAEQDQLPALHMSDRGKLITHCLVGFAITLLLIDYIYFSNSCDTLHSRPSQISEVCLITSDTR